MTVTTAEPQILRVCGHDVRVSVRPGADATATPLLLCNGIGAAFDVLDPFVAEIAPERDVVCFDVPGVGGSPTPTLPYRFAQMAALVMRVTDELGYDAVDVLGLSWGGALAQQIAFQYPRRCRRLVLMSTATGALMVPGSPAVLSKMVTPRRFRDPAYASQVAGLLYGGSARANPAAVHDAFRKQRAVGSARGYLYQLTAGAGWTSLPFLPMIRQQTLVMAGDDDPIIPLANGRILARLIPHARLYVYSGGHVELVSDAPRLAGVVSDFLAE